MSWYYLVVIISLLCLAGLCFPTTRIYAATAFVLLWGTNLLPLDYQRACAPHLGWSLSALAVTD